MNPPDINGRWSLLVYRECVCGFWCATSEGSRAPICPECYSRIPHPWRGPHRGMNAEKARLYPALGFVAQLRLEVSGEESAVAEVRRRNEEAGYPPLEVSVASPFRHYRRELVELMARSISDDLPAGEHDVILAEVGKKLAA